MIGVLVEGIVFVMGFEFAWELPFAVDCSYIPGIASEEVATCSRWGYGESL